MVKCLSIEGAMMRISHFVLFGLLLVAWNTLRAADSSDDLKAWQGTWALVASTYDGESQMSDLQWVVEGSQYRIRMDHHLGEDPYQFSLDASRKHIDVFHHETPRGTYGGKLKGIYKVSGSSLLVCYDLTGTQYPVSFDAKRGSRRVVFQFRRQ
jgi:uncharacterized protein (TIGR03067 family)